MSEEIGVLQAIHTTGSRRLLSTEPIPETVIWEVLDAAIRGPSGGNSQNWGWLVIKDKSVMAPIAQWYRENWFAAYGSRRDEVLEAADAGTGAVSRRTYLAAEHLAEHLEDAPVWIIPVLLGVAQSANVRMGSMIYGAVQNLCLAARAYGVATTLTTLHSGVGMTGDGAHDDELRELLGLPDDALTMALIPMGYPTGGPWAEPKRRPIEQVAYWDHWDVTRRREDASPDLVNASPAAAS
jgi:nitroreductase